MLGKIMDWNVWTIRLVLFQLGNLIMACASFAQTAKVKDFGFEFRNSLLNRESIWCVTMNDACLDSALARQYLDSGSDGIYANHAWWPWFGFGFTSVFIVCFFLPFLYCACGSPTEICGRSHPVLYWLSRNAKKLAREEVSLPGTRTRTHEWNPANARARV